jgi:hypothetical protein
MKSRKRASLRKHINNYCRSCIYDTQARGTWLQQVTLCTVIGCELYAVRPTTNKPIDEDVLDYYVIPKAEKPQDSRSKPLEGRFKKHNSEDERVDMGGG